MGPGTTIEVPAIVEERESTTVVGPGATARVAEDGSLIMELTHELDPVDRRDRRRPPGLDPRRAAGTLVRTAFSTIVRESEDLACGVFDRAGRMLGQSHSGTPGHINAMATGIKARLDGLSRRRRSQPGDVLVTNDPWMTAGQINDLTVATPVFRGDRMIGLFASTCHAPDIGGRLLSAEASDVYEEGLRLPIMKLARAGAMNEDLLDADPRERPHAARDGRRPLRPGRGQRRRRAQPAALPRRPGTRGPRSGRSGDPPPLRDAPCAHAIAELPDGRYEAVGYSDGHGERIELRLAAIIDGDEITLDFAGSSPQSEHGINVVLNYTHAYASFALKAAVAPGVPHNDGLVHPRARDRARGQHPQLPPARARRPRRHVVGHFVPGVVLAALAPVLERHPAGSSDALWISVWSPLQPDAVPVRRRGRLARPRRPQRQRLPVGGRLRARPRCSSSPRRLIQRERSLRTDSGGAGRWRGGLGQTSVMALREGDQWRVSALADRTTVPAPGTDGGHDGAAGEVTVDGRPLPTKRLIAPPARRAGPPRPARRRRRRRPARRATRRPCCATSSTAT